MDNSERQSSSKLKKLSKLKLKKYRELTNSFLIESEKILFEALNSTWKVDEVYLSREKMKLINTLNEYLPHQRPNIFQLSDKEFQKISNEKTPSGVAAIVKKKKFDIENLFNHGEQIIPAFEKISDPGNLGTIIRSIDWFGLNSIVLSEESVEFTNPKVVRASMGSIFHLKIYEKIDLNYCIELARKGGYKVFATSTKGEDIRNFNFNEKYLIIFGNESRGISEEILKFCDDVITIPSFGKAESLNIAISTSIILYEIRRKDFI
ncbi:MAG: RNA methyltransferase [Ignavibacteria bacterium]|nr:RNA methyltransferase [Ignavibacteria bacterium]